MISDDERRAVARRLRGNPEDTLIPHRTGRHHGMGCREAADRFWNMCDRIKEAGNYDIAFSTTSVLADLIEPSCDRDALLALADGLDKDADNIISAARDARFTGCGPRIGEAEHDAYEWRCIANRIRESLGVADA